MRSDSDVGMTGVSGVNSDTSFSTGAKPVAPSFTGAKYGGPSLTGVSLDLKGVGVCTSKESGAKSVPGAGAPSIKSSGARSNRGFSSSASALNFVPFPLVAPLTLAANAEAPKAGNKIGAAAIAPTATAPVLRAEPAFDFQFLTSEDD